MTEPAVDRVLKLEQEFEAARSEAITQLLQRRKETEEQLKVLGHENKLSAKAKKKRKYVYYFGDGRADGSGKMKPLLGGKGANLAEMTRIGLPVPPGFTITTEVCSYFYAHNRSYPAQLKAEVEIALAKVEKSVGKKLGDKERPLLVSVRSGAKISMPGMMAPPRYSPRSEVASMVVAVPKSTTMQGPP